MARMLITIEYDGTDLVGWQAQSTGPSVQAYLEAAAKKLTGADTLIYGSGRTDAGVHATHQAAHLDVPDKLDARAVMRGLNAWLQNRQITVLSAQAVPDEFHARFDAIERSYLYRILHCPSAPALDRHRVWHQRKPLNVDDMAEAATHLIGKHDFSSFRATACQADSPVRTLDYLGVKHVGDEIHVTAKARSFLHHQIRNITGSLVQVGLGKWPPSKMADVLKACDRTKAGPKAPAHGLYLTGVVYPDLPDTAYTDN